MVWTFQSGLNKRSPKKGGKIGARVFFTFELNQARPESEQANIHLIQSLPNLSAFWKNVTNDKRFTAGRLEETVLLKIIRLLQVK